MTKRFKRLIIYAGMHRTGGTSLRTAFASLKSDNLALVDMVRVNHMLPIRLWFADALSDPEKAKKLPIPLDEAQDLLDQVKPRVQYQLETATQDELILTSEWLSSPAVDLTDRIRTLSNIRDYFAPYFDKIEVYAYVRPPAPFCASMYQHTLRSNGVAFQQPWARYRMRFEPLYLVFGRENVHLRAFDRSAFDGGSVVADFQKWAGLSEALEVTVDQRSSMTAAGVALASCFVRNTAVEEGHNLRGHRGRLFDRLDQLGGPKFRFAAHLTDPLIKENRTDMSWIEDQIRVPLREIERDPPITSVLIGGEDEIMRAAAYFAPMLEDEEPIDPPDDPWEADAVAWQRIQHYLEA